jgi:hypothetical protein
VIPEGWKNQGKVTIIQYEPDPVEHAMEGKRIFLVDGFFRGWPTIPKVVMALLKAP